MANYADIKDILNNPTSHGLPAWDNADNQIEGVTMKAHLLNIVNTLSAGGYLFMGVIPSLTYSPSTPDANCFYLATLVGTYSNIGSPALAVAQGEVAIFKYNGTWSKEVTGINQVSVSQNTLTGKTLATINIGSTPIDIKLSPTNEFSASLNGDSAIILQLDVTPNRIYEIGVLGAWGDDDVTSGYSKMIVQKIVGGISTDTTVAYKKGDTLPSKCAFRTDTSFDYYKITLRGDVGDTAKLILTDVTEQYAIIDVIGKYVPGCFLSGSSFQLSANSSYGITPMIRLVSGYTYIFTGITMMGSSPKYHRFNLNREYVDSPTIVPTGSYSATKEFVYTAPNDCYIMASVHTNDKDTFRVIGKFISGEVFGTNYLPESDNKVKLENCVKGQFVYNDNATFTRKLNATFYMGNKIAVSKGDVLVTKGQSIVGSTPKFGKFNNDGTFAGVMDYGASPYFFPISFDGYLVPSFHIDDKSIEIYKIIGIRKEEAHFESEIQNDSLLEVVTDNRSGRFDFTKVGVYDYYAAFDELVSTYQDITKQTAIGTTTTPTGDWAEKDPSTYPINRYTIKKKGSTPAKTLVLCAAIHGDSNNTQNGVVYNNPDDGWYNNSGDSPQNILSVYFFLSDFLKNPTKNVLYRYLYDNYTIEVIPVINAWGVQNHSRGNGNGVDLNRNFDYNWVEGASYDGLTTGTAPFSENESAAFKTFFESLSNVDYCIEVHSRGEILVSSAAEFLAVSDSSAALTRIGNIMAETITNQYVGFKGGFLTAEEDHASLANWVNSVKNVDCFEPECCQSINSDIHTRNTKIVNYHMADFVTTLVTLWGYLKHNTFNGF